MKVSFTNQTHSVRVQYTDSAQNSLEFYDFYGVFVSVWKLETSVPVLVNDERMIFLGDLIVMFIVTQTQQITL